ncbi:acyl-CoA dehydrogenase [Massilia sp. W12]|uniref:acyl-CoA dehydrogenase family protein n=1 Tax=Massilia sp. W12 TaxID=3126507 RepID=UPI0030CCDA3E
MDFTYSTEQEQLREAFARWLEHEYDFAARRAIIHGAGVSDAAWQGLSELGLLALAVPEEAGGLGGNLFDLGLVMQEAGRALLIEPYWATISAAWLLQQAGGQQAVLQRIAQGEVKCALAWQERAARHDLQHIACRVDVSDEGFVLDGEKTVVIHGAQADYLIVSARSNGAPHDEDGVSLFLVPAHTPGLSRREYRTLDGMRAADILFEQVSLPPSALLGQAGGGWALLQGGADFARLLLCAEAFGAMRALFDATLEYVKTRQQFGAPIGKFQALQHRLADMYMQLEQAHSIYLLACAQAPQASGAARARLVSAAKARIGQAARFIGQQAVQLHGGIGVTDELQAAHWFKRLSMIEISLGDTDWHLARFAASSAQEA